MCRFRLRAVFAILAATIVTSQGIAQQSSVPTKPHIVVTPLTAPDHDVVAAKLAETIGDSLELELRLAATATVEKADFLTPNLSLVTAIRYYRRVDAAAAVFGKVVPLDDGRYRVSVSIWDPSNGNSPRNFSRTIDNVFSSFDIADELSLQVGSSILGRKLELGSLQIDNTTGMGNFSVYADGQLLGRDATSFRILTGQREIVVARPGPLGDQPLQVFHVTIKPDHTSIVSLTGTTEQSRSTEKSTTTTGLAAAGTEAQPVHPLGNLTVESEPPGASVYLDKKVLGVTPLNLVGVPVGTYTLRLERKYFNSATQAVEIKEGTTEAVETNLEVDATNPEIQKRMVKPATPAVDSFIWALVQAGMITVPALLQFGLNDPASEFSTGWLYTNTASLEVLPMFAAASNLLYFRIGHHVAQDEAGARALDVADLASAGVYFAAQIAYRLARNRYPGNASQALADVAVAATSVTPLLSILYDVAFSPVAASHHNQTVLDSVQRTGDLPSIPTYREHAFILEGLGGGLARVGYRFPILPGYLSLSPTVGLAEASPTESGLAADAQLRFEWTPFGESSGSVRPVVFVVGDAQTNFSSWSASTGLGIGADFLLGLFDVFTRTDYRYEFNAGTVAGNFTFGIRL